MTLYKGKMEITTVVEMKKRGILTLPEAVRKALGIEEGDILVIKVEKLKKK